MRWVSHVDAVLDQGRSHEADVLGHGFLLLVLGKPLHAVKRRKLLVLDRGGCHAPEDGRRGDARLVRWVVQVHVVEQAGGALLVDLEADDEFAGYRGDEQGRRHVHDDLAAGGLHEVGQLAPARVQHQVALGQRAFGQLLGLVVVEVRRQLRAHIDGVVCSGGFRVKDAALEVAGVMRRVRALVLAVAHVGIHARESGFGHLVESRNDDVIARQVLHLAARLGCVLSFEFLERRRVKNGRDGPRLECLKLGHEAWEPALQHCELIVRGEVWGDGCTLGRWHPLQARKGQAVSGGVEQRANLVVGRPIAEHVRHLHAETGETPRKCGHRHAKEGRAVPERLVTRGQGREQRLERLGRRKLLGEFAGNDEVRRTVHHF
mmetsp:Transcript_1636/g.3453  ORF Transcript_1636/g.3453 Transcript_1636/m.3453 type:complete len:376 (-) Transcript_1636:437-1564(-)